MIEINLCESEAGPEIKDSRTPICKNDLIGE